MIWWSAGKISHLVKGNEMGLDGVELVIALEESFKIDMPDAGLEVLTTPRKLIDCLARRLKVEGP